MPFTGDTVEGVASVESPLLETMNGRGAEVEVQKKRYKTPREELTEDLEDRDDRGNIRKWDVFVCLVK